MKNYVLQNRAVSGGIIYSTLVPKKTGTGFRFEAGQYATIGFKGVNGRLSPMRCFSITSSAASTEQLQFASRLDGDFTHALANLPVGSDMFVQGPFGEFTVNQQYDRNIVMIAGGIGVTPFMSIIRTASATGSSTPMTLLYSYRTGHDIPFHDELRQLELSNPNLRVIMFVSDRTTAPNLPRMLSGRMTEQHIDQVTQGSYADGTYFICGPKGFMESTEAMLRGRGVQDDRIITESFTQTSKITIGNGYSARKITYAFAGAVLLLGVLSIAGLDLSRYVPSHSVAASAIQTPQTTTSPDTSSTSTSTTPSPNNATTTPQTTYQAPVTSVS